MYRQDNALTVHVQSAVKCLKSICGIFPSSKRAGYYVICVYVCETWSLGRNTLLGGVPCILQMENQVPQKRRSLSNEQYSSQSPL
jgi:hypothetical protein